MAETAQEYIERILEAPDASTGSTSCRDTARLEIAGPRHAA